MPYVDRTVFTTNDQSSGEVADPNKLEANDSHIADVVDANYKELYDFANSENISKLGIVNVKDYGAIGDGTTDDTTAFQNAFNENKPVYVPPGTYKITQKLTSNYDNFVLIGQGSNSSVLLFDNTDGIDVAQTQERDIFSIRGLSFVTNANSSYNAIIYNGGNSTGGSSPREIRNCVFIGKDRRNKTGSPYTNVWNKCIYAVNGDKTTISECLFQGAEEDRKNGFPNLNIAIHGEDCTHLYVLDSHVLIFNTGVNVTGQSENFYTSNSDYVACNKGIDVQTSGASNDHNIVGTHISSYTFNINLNVGSTNDSTSMHNIQGCLFFKRSDSTNSFKHVELNCNNTILSNNYFYTNSSVDTVSTGDIGVDIVDGDGNAILNNKFQNQPTILKLSSVVTKTMVVSNMTIDPPATVSELPIIDNGSTNTVLLNNGGDRSFDFVNSSKELSYKSDQNHSFHTGANENLSFKVINGASTVSNYLETYGGATGSPATLRANGTDADIDMTLTPKGSGHVRFGSHTTTSDVPISGYIEVKDSSGTIRKLAVID